ncbi:MAG TPA: hypothetical protein VEK11_14625 [Thermoanaerobaculia bacterium]|nr:hypothetical protein [Thermoanaerobaculia bacterium]
MLAEVVFVTRLLGLAAGEQVIALKADPEVRRIEIRRDETTIATMTDPPWRMKVALGEDLGPYELSAIGFDANGKEAGRDAQLVNLARPMAETGILLNREGDVLFARLQWTHIRGKRATKAQLTFDGKVVSRDVSSAPVRLGKADPKQIHVVSAEVWFEDSEHARKDLVFGGIYTEEMPSELTAIAVRVQDERKADGCIHVEGREVTPTAIEQGTALVSFVVNGGAPISLHEISPARAKLYELQNADIVVLSPVVSEGPGAQSFATEAVPKSRGTRGAVILDRRVKGAKRFADAVAAGALRSLRMHRRRVVVHIIGASAAPDESEHSPGAVRRYLERVGVPLRVWSLTGPRPDLADTWGAVQDVSTSPLLVKATEELRQELAAQRIAWIPAGPLEAIRAEASADCGVMPIAGGAR